MLMLNSHRARSAQVTRLLCPRRRGCVIWVAEVVPLIETGTAANRP